MMNTPTQTADLSLPDLRRMLRDTERSAGSDSQAAGILRRLVVEHERFDAAFTKELAETAAAEGGSR